MLRLEAILTAMQLIALAYGLTQNDDYRSLEESFSKIYDESNRRSPTFFEKSTMVKRGKIPAVLWRKTPSKTSQWSPFQRYRNFLLNPTKKVVFAKPSVRYSSFALQSIPSGQLSRQVPWKYFALPVYRPMQGRPMSPMYRSYQTRPALHNRGWTVSSSGTNVNTGTNSHTVSNSQLKAPGQTTTNTHVINKQQTSGRIRELAQRKLAKRPIYYRRYPYMLYRKQAVRGKVSANARVNAKASASTASASNAGSAHTTNGGSRTTSGSGGWGGGMGAGYGYGPNAWGVGWGGGGGGSAGSIPSSLKGFPGIPTSYNGVKFPGMPSQGFPSTSGSNQAGTQGSPAGAQASNGASHAGSQATYGGASAANGAAPGGAPASYTASQGMKNRKPPSASKGKNVSLKPRKGLNEKLKAAKAFKVLKGQNNKAKVQFPARGNYMRAQSRRINPRPMYPWQSYQPARVYRIQYFTNSGKHPTSSEWENMRQKIISNVIQG